MLAPSRPFQLASFLGAALLFLIQPLLAKQILPWFGGGSAVWSACLLFFQLGLVAGYAYAHLTRRLPIARQATLHVVLLAVAAALLPVSPSDAWKPPDGEHLVGRVLYLLLVNVGLPYVLLAATAPLIQDWDARRRTAGVRPGSDLESVDGRLHPRRPESPYRLYVISNVGSLLALIAYPAWLEPWLPLSVHHQIWSAAFVAFVAVCAWCAWIVTSTVSGVPHAQIPELSASSPAAIDIEVDRVTIPPAVRVLFWFLLPAIGSGLLMATTSTLTQDVAAMPLIWIAPLALYLVTFILAFAGWYLRPVWAFMYVALLFATIYAFRSDASTPAVLQATALLAVAFAGEMICHGELVRLRPPVDRLTGFYLALAIGGSLGGAFVALGAPLWFNSTIELPILHLATVAALAALWTWTIAGRLGALLRVLAPPAALALVAIPGARALSADAGATHVVAQERGFYGVVRITDEPAQSIRRLYHGRILHGLQFTTPVLSQVATTYYTEGSGVDLAIREHPRRRRGAPLIIGAVGLGTGTVAALGAAGDRIRFFEIDPVVIRLSQQHFTFVSGSPAAVEIVPGDARLTLEREIAQGGTAMYDVLVLDAFSGDAIPVHLLTAEAFGIYDRALAEDGVIAIHVSNRYLELRPVVRGLAAPRGFEVLEIYHQGTARARATSNTWMLVTRNREFAETIRPRARDTAEAFEPVVWTDDFSSLLAVWRPRD
jgi:spermidine synthase